MAQDLDVFLCSLASSLGRSSSGCNFGVMALVVEVTNLAGNSLLELQMQEEDCISQLKEAVRDAWATPVIFQVIMLDGSVLGNGVKLRLGRECSFVLVVDVPAGLAQLASLSASQQIACLKWMSEETSGDGDDEMAAFVTEKVQDPKWPSKGSWREKAILLVAFLDILPRFVGRGHVAACSAVCRRFDSGDVNVTRAALRVVAEIACDKDQAVIGDLIARVATGTTVAELCLLALGSIAGRGDAQVRAVCLQKSRDRDINVRIAALAALRQVAVQNDGQASHHDLHHRLHDQPSERDTP